MSFTNLKKTTRTAKIKADINADRFINDAVFYAYGINTQHRNYEKSSMNDSEFLDELSKNATFSLTTSSIEALNELSLKSNISKSRIVRILIQNELQHFDAESLAKKGNGIK